MKTNKILDSFLFYLLDYWIISFVGCVLISMRIIKLDYVDLGIRIIGGSIWFFSGLFSLMNSRLNSKHIQKIKKSIKEKS